MIEALIIAGAILASAILLIVYPRSQADPEIQEVRIRMWAKSLVRAIEKRSQWDETLNSSHVKRARLKLFLTEQFPAVSNDWLDIIIEEAVFDMEASNVNRFSFGTRTGSERDVDGLDLGGVGDSGREDGIMDVGDHDDFGDPTGTTGEEGWSYSFDFEPDGENLPMPSAE